MQHKERLDVIIPISLDLDWPTVESTVADILDLNKKYGFWRFALASPCGGWRSIGYPPTKFFEENAKMFLEVKEKVAPYGIECGWWDTLTVRSGKSGEFNGKGELDGSESPVHNCPRNPVFRKRFAENVSIFSKIAKPAFIFTEDDFYIGNGCFCDNCLNEFAKKQGRYYTREELREALKGKPESIETLRAWREFSKSSVVGLAKAIREKLDVESPEIPIGYMQSGNTDFEGDSTEEVARALAGDNHTPFSRLYGVFYCGVDLNELPRVLYHPLYSRQHIKGDFKYYYEADTYPHTRFYTTGRDMRSIMGIVFSYGFEGAVHQAYQLLDSPQEETAYGKMYAQERVRYNEVYRIAEKCNIKGVEICYDPFWNTIGDVSAGWDPRWIKAVGLFGIPHTTVPSNVAFWDDVQAKYADDETVMEYLSKGLFLDGEAAKCLCERGYGKYIGVDIGGVDSAEGNVRFDLAAREVICDKLVSDRMGRNMPSAHMWCPAGNGKLYKMEITDKTCEVVSEFYTYQRELITPAMTRFENELGGRVVVMGMTVKNNNSQALFNYRRQRLIQELISWCSDEYFYVKEAAKVYAVMNEADEKEDFRGMITIVNLCSDDLEKPQLHLPEAWRDATEFYALDVDANWVKLEYSKTDDGIELSNSLSPEDPMYIKVC